MRKTLGIRPLIVAYSVETEEGCKAQVSKYVSQYANCPLVFDIEKNIKPAHMVEVIKWVKMRLGGRRL